MNLYRIYDNKLSIPETIFRGQTSKEVLWHYLRSLGYIVLDISGVDSESECDAIVELLRLNKKYYYKVNCHNTFEQEGVFYSIKRYNWDWLQETFNDYSVAMLDVDWGEATIKSGIVVDVCTREQEFELMDYYAKYNLYPEFRVTNPHITLRGCCL